MNTATVIADIQTPDGVISIDTRMNHCGNCEHRYRGFCNVFGDDLAPETRGDGLRLDWRRCADCLAAQVAAD